MAKFENSILIERPVEEVFDFVADFEQVPKWNYYVEQVTKLSDGPVGRGTRYHQQRKNDQQQFRVTQYMPYKRATVKTEPGFRPQFERRFDFESLPGATRIIDSWTLKTRYSLFDQIGARRIKAAVADNLLRLKELLETGQTQLQDGRMIRQM